MEADELSNIRIIHGDSLEAMKAMPDKAYDLAIVDPPYGIGEKLINGGTWAKDRKKEYSGWDKVPPQEYFNSLFRVSKNQIIFGGNYFNLPPCRCFIVWDKPQMRIATMADCEYAWTSFDSVAKIASILQDHGVKRIHLAQKPIELYMWILRKFAKPGDKILDTHGGSCSIAVACDIMGFDCDIWEIDADYHRAAVERFERHKQQTVLEFTA